MNSIISQKLSIFDYITEKKLNEFVDYIFAEDFGEKGDITTNAIFKEKSDQINAIVKSNTTGVIAGVEIFSFILRKLDTNADINVIINDGNIVRSDDVILKINCNIANLLKAERICLNLFGRLSGIASITRRFVEKVEGTKCRILDTRKTTPGIRFLEKYAVKVGGGTNHRMGLYDVVLIKDNHIDGCPGITECVARVRNTWGNKYNIIVETRNLEEVKEALKLDVDRILIDNMPVELIKEVVKIVDNKVPLEASGNITLDNVSEIARAGVDYVSTSYITAWAQPLDLSLIIN